MTPEERRHHDITPQDIHATLLSELEAEANDKKEFIGAHIPYLDLDYIDVETDNQYPLDFRHTTIKNGISAAHARFEERVDLRNSTVGGLHAPNCEFEDGLLASKAVFTDVVTLSETVFNGDTVDFTDTTFEQSLVCEEITVAVDLFFEHAEFNGRVSFDGAWFAEQASTIDDNTIFNHAIFHDIASFKHTSFYYTAFQDVTFYDMTTFKQATANGTIRLNGSTFHAAADFDELHCEEDISFGDVVFHGKAFFRGVSVIGGADVLADDFSLANTRFNAETTFERGTFGFTNAEDAKFNACVNFERSTFSDDADFVNTTFADTADFDEVIFDGDVAFTNTTFDADAVFRGAEFNGGTNYIESDAVFNNVTFTQKADFSDTDIVSIEFNRTEFQSDVDFTDAEITETFIIENPVFVDDPYLDFTDATIEEGTIMQPDRGWGHFDFTQATVGDVLLTAADQVDRRELLDYFRFCDTTFDTFDFSQHLEYLDRNNWVLHTFAHPETEFTPALELTPARIEKTYLKAKSSASAQSNIKAAGEFRVKRQQYARRKFTQIAADSAEPIRTRIRNGLRTAENLFLEFSCGYGLRLYRITTVFILVPLIAAILFTFAGPLFETSAGQASLSQALNATSTRTLLLNVYFSYITFLTIGYGGIGPLGLGARFLAAILVYLNVILAGLFIYSLIKRSEI
ncbi:pentapeptide repeat-containing protein [Haloquadratum walsbyi]|nr:pentapeptide repeat-containing protein [Haloquadratum walsbyi]